MPLRGGEQRRREQDEEHPRGAAGEQLLQGEERAGGEGEEEDLEPREEGGGEGGGELQQDEREPEDEPCDRDDGHGAPGPDRAGEAAPERRGACGADDARERERGDNEAERGGEAGEGGVVGLEDEHGRAGRGTGQLSKPTQKTKRRLRAHSSGSFTGVA